MKWTPKATRLEDAANIMAGWLKSGIYPPPRNGIHRAAWLCALLGVSACATSGDIDRLDARVDTLEGEREQLRAKMSEDMGKLERLHAMLTEAEETLRKNGADLGIRLARMEQDFPKFKGDVEAFAFRVNQVTKDLSVIKKELADRLGWTVVYLPPDLPKDKDGIWKVAEDLGKADRFQEAKAVYEVYEASFPDDPRAAQALVEVGKLFERAGDVEGAIAAYQNVYSRHEKSPLAAPSTFRIAELLIVRQNCDRAKAIFRFIEAQFKGTPEAAEAKARGKTVMAECHKGR